MAKVSTIIPTYNCEQYIRETIESALSQTYKDMEFIVVDDGSTDRTEEIIKSFSPKLKYIHYNENQGPSAARNRGIKEAQGEYVAFLDHDDIWMPTKIEEQIKLFENNKDLALAYSNFCYVDHRNVEMGALFDTVKPQRGFVFEKLILDNFVPTTSVIAKKKILEEVGGFNERFMISHDFDLYLRIAERYQIDFIDSPLVKHRIYPDSASSKKRKIMLEETINITTFYKDRIRLTNTALARELDKRIAKYIFYMALWMLEHANRKEALSRYFDSVRTGAFDYKILLGGVFFIIPRFISIPLMRKLIKINRT